jgi:hypothetical protein
MRLLVILCAILASLSAGAKEIKIPSDGGLILFNAPASWELKHDIFGMENWLFSPKLNNSRSNITVTNTKSKIQLNFDSIKKSRKNYEKLKQNWADRVQAKVISFKPMKAQKNTNGNLVNSIGFSYVFKGKKYIEDSYYIDCRGTVVFVKSLRLEVNLDHQEDINQMINSMDCSL